MRATLSGTVVLLAWLSQASIASAEPRQRVGFEPSAHVGVGTFPSHLTFDGAPAWAPGRRNATVGVHLDLAYRFAPLIDVGLHVFHQWLVVDGLDAGSDATATASGAGTLVRLHPLTALWARLPIDLSLGVGFDFFASARQTTESRSGATTTESRAAIPGVSVPVWVGLDVVLGAAALGVVAIWAPWWRIEECTSMATGVPECRRESSAPTAYLFLGLGFRLHLEFVQ